MRSADQTDPGSSIPPRRVLATMLVAAIVTIAVTAGMCTGWLTIGVEREWTWDLNPTGGAAKLWIAVLAFVLFLASVVAVSRQLGQGKLAAGGRQRFEDVLLLAVLIVLGIALQLGVGQLAKSGLHEWPAIVAIPWTNGYFDTALDIDDLGHFLRNYHRLMPQLDFHSRTHPPGPVLMFWSINWLFESCPTLTRLLAQRLTDSAFDPTELLAALREGMGRDLTAAQVVGAWASSVAMMVICVAGCVPMFFMGRLLFGRTTGFWAAAIYLASPCVLYFTPALDQVVAAVCAAAGCLWLMALAPGNRDWHKDGPSVGARPAEPAGAAPTLPRRDAPAETCGWRAMALAFCAGLVLAAGSLLSISTGAFAAMLALFWMAELLANRSRWGAYVRLALAACVGTVTFHLAFYALTGYQCVPTFLKILSVARENVRQQYIQRPVVFTYHRWLFWNLVEFFLGVGWAAAVCFLACIWQPRLRNRLILVFLAALLLLDVSGTSMSETARLWMAFAVLPMTFAAGFVSRTGKWQHWAGAGILVLSIAQAVSLKLCFGWI